MLNNKKVIALGAGLGVTPGNTFLEFDEPSEGRLRVSAAPDTISPSAATIRQDDVLHLIQLQYSWNFRIISIFQSNMYESGGDHSSRGRPHAEDEGGGVPEVGELNMKYEILFILFTIHVFSGTITLE